MAKSSGLGDNFYLHGWNLSGDVSTVSTSQPVAVLETTAIDKSAIERLQGQRSGTIEFTAFYNDSAVYPYSSHLALKGRSTNDQIATYFRGTTLGNPAASMVCKQVDYNPTRAADGSLTSTVQCVSNGYGLEWGRSLTAGVRVDTTATNGASIDTTASASFGGQAYLQTFRFSGTDVTVKIQDSADDASWADVSGFTFTVIPGLDAERLALSNTATIRRYVRAVTTTSAGFTSVSFAVMIVKNEIAGTVF